MRRLPRGKPSQLPVECEGRILAVFAMIARECAEQWFLISILELGYYLQNLVPSRN